MDILGENVPFGVYVLPVYGFTSFEVLRNGTPIYMENVYYTLGLRLLQFSRDYQGIYVVFELLVLIRNV